MATETNYLKLSKADKTDAILGTLDSNNANFDTLDTKVEEIDGKISELETKVDEGTETSLPVASSTVLGGIKVGANLTIAEDGTLSAPAGGEGGSSAEGITILEASTENVIDFDTLTEPGVYLIKNVSDGAGTTLNSGVTNANYLFTVILEVILSKTIEGYSTPTDNIFQRRYATTSALPYTRSYNKLAETPAWSEWTYGKVGAANISAGTFISGIKCATPTESTHLANMGYVDNAIASAITSVLEASY